MVADKPIQWKNDWMVCINSVLENIEFDPTAITWKNIRKDLEDGYFNMLINRLDLVKKPKTLKSALRLKQNTVEALNCLKNLEEAVRYIKYKLADFGRHTEAFRAAGYQNFCLTGIARLQKRWLKYLFRQLHRFLSYYNTQPWRWGIWVIITIFVFSGLYQFFGCIIANNPESLKFKFYHYLYFSILTLTASDCGEFGINPNNQIGLFLNGLESIGGYAFLALLVYMIFHISEIHPYSPPEWMKYYEEKLSNLNFFFRKERLSINDGQ